MSALDIYNKKAEDAETYNRNLTEDELSRKLVLDQDLGKLKRQLELLNLDMEKCELFTPDDEGCKFHLRDNMAKVKNIIITTEDKIRNIYLEPYALAVWQEGESTIHRLKCEIQEQFARCCELKEVYLKEISKLGTIKKLSDTAASEASKVRLAINPPRNPMQGINVSKESTFVVELGEIQKLIR
jgi:uncharacterized protein with PIN domain